MKNVLYCRLKKCFAYCAFLFLTGCATNGHLRSFTTDGCSFFPDRAYIDKADWRACCVDHDWEYWKGGTKQGRLDADYALKTCVAKTANSDVLANVMFAGVRLAGGPYLYTPFRWGYGWTYLRPYMPLTEEEKRLAASLECAYRKDKDASYVCP